MLSCIYKSHQQAIDFREKFGFLNRIFSNMMMVQDSKKSVAHERIFRLVKIATYFTRFVLWLIEFMICWLLTELLSALFSKVFH